MKLIAVFPVLIFLISGTIGSSGGKLEDTGSRGIALTGVANKQNNINPNKTPKKRLRPQLKPDASLQHRNNPGEEGGENEDKLKRRPPHPKPKNSPRISPDTEKGEGGKPNIPKRNLSPNPKPNKLAPRLALLRPGYEITKDAVRQWNSGEIEDYEEKMNNPKLGSLRPHPNPNNSPPIEDYNEENMNKPQPESLRPHPKPRPKPNNYPPRRPVVDTPRAKEENEKQWDSGEDVNKDESEEKIKKTKKRPRPRPHKPKHKKSPTKRNSDENETDNDENQGDSGENESRNEKEKQERRKKTKKRKHHKHKNLPRDFNTTYKKSYNNGQESFTMNSHSHPED